MKSKISRISDSDFIRLFPVAGPVATWRFAVEEVSAGVYECRGGDQWGRVVSRKGTDANALLEQCSQGIRDLLAADVAGT